MAPIKEYNNWNIRDNDISEQIDLIDTIIFYAKVKIQKGIILKK